MDRGWEGLFADLEAQFDGQERRQLDAEVADRIRRERAQVELIARLVGHCGSALSLRTCTATALEGTLVDVGEGWLLLDQQRRSHLVSLARITSVEGLGVKVEAPARARRFGLGYALRGIARDRSPVVITDQSARALTGTIDSVGADHIDLAEHPLEDARRVANVRARKVLPFSAIVVVSRA